VAFSDNRAIMSGHLLTVHYGPVYDSGSGFDYARCNIKYPIELISPFPELTDMRLTIKPHGKHTNRSVDTFLEKRILVAGCAMGTAIQDKTSRPKTFGGVDLEGATKSHPSGARLSFAISTNHTCRSFEIIETNTFRRASLSPHD